MVRAEAHQAVTVEGKARLAEREADLNSAAIQRQILDPSAQLLAVATIEAPPLADPRRASADESTTTSNRAS